MLPIVSTPHPSPRSTVATIWIIARRGALEALRDRSTVLTAVFFAIVFPFFLVQSIVQPAVADPKQSAQIGSILATLLLTAGLLNTSAAVGIASGVFVGEKEKGNLLPLLATPASNFAIFGGKILSAVLPAMLFALTAQVAFLIETAIFINLDTLLKLAIIPAFASVVLVPTLALFTATIASIISSRVRTFNAAQTIGGIILLPLWFGLIALTGAALRWGIGVVFLTIVLLLLADMGLIILGARTWRREEVLAQQ